MIREVMIEKIRILDKMIENQTNNLVISINNISLKIKVDTR